MGRAKYTPEKRNEIVTAFVKATVEILNESGVDGVSIRSVSSRAGYSSAALYLYFKDLNELMSIASISYLRNYVRDIAETSPGDDCTAEELYRYTWETFADHALNKPAIYLNLFYGKNSDSLEKVVDEYYRLFPEELESIREELLLTMLESGGLLARNKIVLTPYAEELGMTENEIDLANKITVAYFRSILAQASEYDSDESKKLALFNEFMQGVFFILRS